jgi:hypothetical protein
MANSSKMGWADWGKQGRRFALPLHPFPEQDKRQRAPLDPYRAGGAAMTEELERAAAEMRRAGVPDIICLPDQSQPADEPQEAEPPAKFGARRVADPRSA